VVGSSRNSSGAELRAAALAERQRLARDNYGLTGMRERAELLGGTLDAAPTGTGFRVLLRVPAGDPVGDGA
jgi:signal transduction histidine kinase